MTNPPAKLVLAGGRMLFDDIFDQRCNGFQLFVIQPLQIFHQLVESGGIFCIHIKEVTGADTQILADIEETGEGGH